MPRLFCPILLSFFTSAPFGRDVKSQITAKVAKTAAASLQRIGRAAMAPNRSRVVEWKQQQVQVLEIPIEGVREGVPPQNCEPSYALVFAGLGRTDGGGSWTVSLPAISCERPAPGGDRRPSVVATPTTDGPTDDVPRPYVLVARTSGANITIWSFTTGGQTAPDVEFSWHCIVEGTLVT
jgi:hypothetical protein